MGAPTPLEGGGQHALGGFSLTTEVWLEAMRVGGDFISYNYIY